MRKVGINYAYWCEEWDADYNPYIDKAASLGFDQLEIGGGAVVAMSERDLRNLKAHADDKGIILSYGIGLAPQYDVASLDVNVREAGIAFMTELIRKVGYIGGGLIGGTTYSCWPGRPQPGISRERYTDLSIGSMKTLSKVAENENVTILCEAQNRFEHFLINTAEEGVAFIDAVGSNACKLLLDTFHMNIEEDSFGDAIRTAGNLLGELHAGEANRRPVGEGRLPWAEIKTALDDIGFDGPIVEEPFVLTGCAVGRDVLLWRELYKDLDLDELARKSAVYMRENLT